MTTAVAVRQQTDALAVSDDELRVLKETLNPDLSNAELRLFALVAKRSGLDPFAKQIFAVKRQGRVTFQTSQEGYLSIAERTNEYDGCDEPEYGPLTNGVPVHPEWATVRVYRKGMSRGVAATAYWNEYYPGDQQGHMWKKMPRVMLAKVARVAALRLAFPYVYADLYSEDEMAQADSRPAPQPATARVVVHTPAAGTEDAPASSGDAPPPISDGEAEARTEDPSAPVYQGQDTYTGIVAIGNGSPTDGQMRFTPDAGQFVGFKLTLAQGGNVQVVAEGDLALALDLATQGVPSLHGVEVTCEGALFAVPWDKDGKRMRPYKRLVLERITTPEMVIPAVAS